MDRWFAGSIDRWFDGSLVRWIVGSLDRWFDGSLVRWIVVSMDRWFVGSMNKLCVGSLVGWIYRHIFRHIHEGYVAFADLQLSGLISSLFPAIFCTKICFKGLGKDRKECLFSHIEVDCLGAKSR